MPWLVIILGYLIGSVPTAYIAGRLLKDIDIRQLGDGNAGARNAFHQLGHKTGVSIFIIDVTKGILVISLAQLTSVSQFFILLSGLAAVIGHNWPVFIGFRGGRGESTTIGVLFMLITQPVLIVAGPALVILALRKNVILASAILFVPLPLVCWWLGIPAILVVYSIALPCLVGLTHFIRTNQIDTSITSRT
jgi:glycerol-3-phosphate acyltransferase PlsY